jgi:hypothetical protein
MERRSAIVKKQFMKSLPYQKAILPQGIQRYRFGEINAEFLLLARVGGI